MIVEVSVICFTAIVLAAIWAAYGRSPKKDNTVSEEVLLLRKMIDDQAVQIKKLNSKVSLGLIQRSL